MAKVTLNNGSTLLVQRTAINDNFTELYTDSHAPGSDDQVLPTALSELSEDATHRLVTDTEKSTWNAKQAALVADTDYLTPGTAASTYAPALGVDDYYVTDAEKTVIGNTSGTNTGDQDLSGKQDILVSATNIKTVNGFSLLGAGDLVVSGGSALTVVDESTTLDAAVTKLIFAGTGVTATEGVDHEITVTIAAGSAPIDTVNGQTGTVVLDAGDIDIVDAGGLITGTTVEAALQENRTAIDALEVMLDPGVDGDFGITLANNVGGKTPTASAYEIYVDAGAWKINTNGTEATLVYSGSALGTPASGDLANCSFPVLNQSTSGNAATATALASARTIGGVSFDGTANIDLPGVNTAGNQNTTGTAANVTGTVAVANGGTGLTSLGTGVATAMGNAVNGAAGFPTIIAKGTTSLGTGAIASGASATVISVSATGVATTDVIDWTFNVRPSQVTGYAPLTTGCLRVDVYPTANNINIEISNMTAAEITRAAISINWKVQR